MNSRSFFVCRGNTNYSLQETEAAGWIPMYIRTRSVTVRELKIDGYQHVLCTCSCKTFYHNLVQCRHVFAILGRSPSHLDAFPECRKDYALWYGDDRQPDFNAKVDKRTKLLEHFGGMIYEGTLDNNIQIDSSLLREHDEDLFGETYDGNPRRSVQWTTGAGWRPSGTVPCTAPSPKRPMRSTTQNKFHTRIFEGSAFLQLRKLFEHICNLAVTPAQIAELRELLDRCHQRMLITGVDSKNTSDTGRVIMNNNDREDTNDNGREVMNDIEDNGMHDIEDVEDDGMSQVEFTRKTTIHGLQSFSAICKVQTRKRLRPVSSPPKR